jgi:hypothetical protein
MEACLAPRHADTPLIDSVVRAGQARVLCDCREVCDSFCSQRWSSGFDSSPGSGMVRRRKPASGLNLTLGTELGQQTTGIDPKRAFLRTQDATQRPFPCGPPGVARTVIEILLPGTRRDAASSSDTSDAG